MKLNVTWKWKKGLAPKFVWRWQTWMNRERKRQQRLKFLA